jgi:hypothetical protein
MTSSSVSFRAGCAMAAWDKLVAEMTRHQPDNSPAAIASASHRWHGEESLFEAVMRIA